ncbi:MAG: hypothetical protein WKF92_12315 [Pyrinomonadaceae bacterium]
MFYKGFIKRIVPFFLTFAAGLFIASIFVPLSIPNLKMPSRGSHKYREVQRLRSELNESRRESNELKKEIRELKQNAINAEFDAFEGVPPVAIDAPPPPPDPVVPHSVRRVLRHDR